MLKIEKLKRGRGVHALQSSKRDNPSVKIKSRSLAAASIVKSNHRAPSHQIIIAPPAIDRRRVGGNEWKIIKHIYLINKKVNI